MEGQGRKSATDACPVCSTPQAINVCDSMAFACTERACAEHACMECPCMVCVYVLVWSVLARCVPARSVLACGVLAWVWCAWFGVHGQAVWESPAAHMLTRSLQDTAVNADGPLNVCKPVGYGSTLHACAVSQQRLLHPSWCPRGATCTPSHAMRHTHTHTHTHKHTHAHYSKLVSEGCNVHAVPCHEARAHTHAHTHTHTLHQAGVQGVLVAQAIGSRRLHASMSRHVKMNVQERAPSA